MSLIVPYVENGDVIEASDHDTFLDDLATFSAAIDTANIRDEAVGLQHFDMTSDPYVVYYNGYVQDDSANAYNHSGTSYQVVGYGVTPSALNLELTGINTAITDGHVIEIFGSVTTRDPTITADTDDLFSLRTYVTTGGGDTTVGPRRVFSMQGSDGSSSTANNPDDQICQRKIPINIYHVWRDSSALLDEVSIRCNVSNAGNSIEFARWNLAVRIVKH